MATDKRKKGCPNEECEQHQKKVKLKATESYCSKCGTELIYRSENHRYTEGCGAFRDAAAAFPLRTLEIRPPLPCDDGVRILA